MCTGQSRERSESSRDLVGSRLEANGRRPPSDSTQEMLLTQASEAEFRNLTKAERTKWEQSRGRDKRERQK